MSDEDISRPAGSSVRVEREAINEVQDPVTPPSTSFVPHHVGQQTGNDGEPESDGQRHPSGACKRASSNENQNRRYWQPHLARENGCEQNRVPVRRKKLDDGIHSDTSRSSAAAAQPTDCPARACGECAFFP